MKKAAILTFRPEQIVNISRMTLRDVQFIKNVRCVLQHPNQYPYFKLAFLKIL